MSPYRAQVREIKNEVKKILPRTISKPFDTMLVDTVDGMQGQERNYIIYSFANSHPLESMRRLDFFYSPNRLNVAITRSIKKCFVISNYKVFDIIDEELREHKEYNEKAVRDAIISHIHTLPQLEDFTYAQTQGVQNTNRAISMAEEQLTKINNNFPITHFQTQLKRMDTIIKETQKETNNLYHKLG
jgi:hypothetical protein